MLVIFFQRVYIYFKQNGRDLPVAQGELGKLRSEVENPSNKGVLRY